MVTVTRALASVSVFAPPTVTSMTSPTATVLAAVGVALSMSPAAESAAPRRASSPPLDQVIRARSAARRR